MSIEMNILYEPDDTKLKLPRFHAATITHNGNSVADPLTPIGNLGEINIGDTFSLSMNSYVYKAGDATHTEIPLASDSDPYTYKKYHSLQPLGSLPSSLVFVNLTDGVTITGTIYALDAPTYEFLVRVTLEVYNKTTGDLVRVDVDERYFYFTTSINANTFYWDPNWLDSQMILTVDNQKVYFLGSWARGENISIPTSLYNPNNLPVKYSVESTGFTNDLASQENIIPIGLHINETYGTIDGSISISNDPGYFYFKIDAIDGTNIGNPPTNSVIFAIRAEETINTNTTPNDSVIWVTPSDSLGTTYSTYASHFSVLARNPAGQAISYSLAPSSAELPGSLSIDSTTGLIIGSCPFVTSTQVFQIRIRATVNANYSDRLFSFTVLPLYTNDAFLTVNIPITEKIRQIVTNWAWNTDAIPDDQVFRLTDFNFSRTINPMILVTAGLINNVTTSGYWYNNPDNKGAPEPENGSTLYEPDLTNSKEANWYSCFEDKLRGYHRPFTLRIGEVAWAPGYDPDGNHVYDIVYLKVYDPQVDQLAFSNGVEILYNNPTKSLENSSFTNSSDLDMEHSFFQVPNATTTREYPVCLMNCRLDLITTTNRITSPTYYQSPNASPGIGINGSEGLPLWMKDSEIAGDTESALGWVAAIPLVYCTPGSGTVLSVNLKQLGLEQTLTGQTFEVDRYVVSITSDKYIIWDPTMNPTTTFDDITVPTYEQTLFDVQLNYSDKVILFPRLNDAEQESTESTNSGSIPPIVS